MNAQSSTPRSPARVRPTPSNSQDTGWASPWHCSTKTQTPLQPSVAGRLAAAVSTAPAASGSSSALSARSGNTISKATAGQTLTHLQQPIQASGSMTGSPCGFISMASVGHTCWHRAPQAMHLPSTSFAFPRGFFGLAGPFSMGHLRQLWSCRRTTSHSTSLPRTRWIASSRFSPSPCTISPLDR